MHFVIVMRFETTASDTGRVNGNDTLLETAIGRKVSWMACRHHMFEVLLSDAFVLRLAKFVHKLSQRPDSLLFKRDVIWGAGGQMTPEFGGKILFICI